MPTLRRTGLDRGPANGRLRRPVTHPTARAIAEHVARLIEGEALDGPDGRRLIVRAAFSSPHVRTERQAELVADGFEGRVAEWNRGARRTRLCRLAGRHLALIVGVLR